MPFDFIVGDRDGSTASPALTDWVVAQLRSEGFTVGVNDVFKGAELVRRHGDPANQRHSLQLEINKRLYMDEQQLALHAGFSRLQATLKRLVMGLISGAAARLPLPATHRASEN